MRVLITGSHGFVGSNLIEAFESTYNIIRWDVREGKPLPECDAVIHLVGKAHDTKNASHEDEYYEVNTELTKKIFDAFLKSKAKKFIFFSSIKAKDNDTPYAKSKKAAEDYIEDVRNKKVTRDKHIYILRPCMIHGKGVKGNLPQLFKFIKRGWPWPLAAFENKRSYASMGNVIFIVSKLLSLEVPSGIYNICDDEPVSTNELVEIICQCKGEMAHMWRIPQKVMKSIAYLGDIFHFPLNTERLGKLTGNCIISNYDIKKNLGINRLPIGSKDGLRYTIEMLNV